MQPFPYVIATTVTEATQLALARSGARFLAGGTTLVDLMKSGQERPSLVIDINRLQGLTGIEYSPESNRLQLGALARMSDVAANMNVRQNCPVVAESLLFAASGQLRNMASLGGNLLQRTRCLYFRDRSFPCNKREPGSGCGAIAGENRNLAVLGVSERCIANYAGDFAISLAALDAVVHTAGPSGDRRIPIREFHMLPQDTPHIEHILAPGELITQIEIPISSTSKNSHYLKVRDRASYEFASVSVAAALTLEPDGTMSEIRIALGGLATKPWRATIAEGLLRGKHFDDAGAIREATDQVLAEAQPQSKNAYKVSQARTAIPRALRVVARMALSALAEKGTKNAKPY